MTVERTGLKDLHFHDLRHAYGSWLAMEGVIAEGRMALMGHKTPSMTLRYTHLDMGFKHQAVAKLHSLRDMKSPQISPREESPRSAIAT